MNNIDMYEQMLLDDFRHQILEGRVTVDTLKRMIEENSLSVNQLKVIEELAPFLGGVANLAKNAAQGVGNLANKAVQGVKNMGSNIANTYNQGRQQAVLGNAVKAAMKALGDAGNALQQLQGVTGEDYSNALNYFQQMSAYANSLVNPQPAQQQQQQPVQQRQATAPQNTTPNPVKKAPVKRKMKSSIPSKTGPFNTP